MSNRSQQTPSSQQAWKKTTQSPPSNQAGKQAIEKTKQPEETNWLFRKELC
jgi:hypothetical protein